MNGKGKMIYVPPELLESVESIQVDHGFRENENTKAIKELVKYAEVGREVERIIKLDFRPVKDRSVKMTLRELFTRGVGNQ